MSTTTGSINLDGKDITNLPHHARPLVGLGRSFQITSLFNDFTVIENLRLASQAITPSRGFVFWRAVENTGPPLDIIKHIAGQIGLLSEKNTLVSVLSHGQQRALEVGMALCSNPRVLLLDEPTSGMGISDIPQMIKLLKILKQECTIVLIEHNVALVTEVCDFVTVLQGGVIISEGTPAEISQDRKVKTAYLGEGI